MSISLKNQTILITGSTDGLGKLLAKNLAMQGANIVVTGRNQEKVDSVLTEIKEAGPGKHRGVVCDLNKPETVEKSFKDVDKLDILINNAGLWQEGATKDVSLERIVELVNVNLTSYLLLSRLMLPFLQLAEFGQILNVVSVAGYEVPSGYFHTIYTATKFGLQGFSEGMTKEFEGKNIRVMGFYPGGMDTKLFVKAGLDYKEKEPWMFDPQESVDAIIFMLSRNQKVNVKRMDLINHLS